MLSATEGQQQIIDAIINKTPFCVGKFGANECNTLRGLIDKAYNSIPYAIYTNAGVFPLDLPTLEHFKDEYRVSIEQTDLLLRWAEPWGESKVLKEFNYTGKSSEEWGCYEPFFIENNWTNYLAGKKVLAITSHTNTTELQYPKLDKIWNNKLFKDKFELTLLKPPLQPQFEQYHNSWGESLEWLKSCMHEADYDILIVGAGAYGLPLAAEAKKMGKVGIHMGGAIQILFGILGHRWETEHVEQFGPLFNEHWIKPLPEDTPEGKEAIEQGCYW